MRDGTNSKMVLSVQERKAKTMSDKLNRKLHPKEFCILCIMQNCNPLEIPSCILLREAREKGIIKEEAEELMEIEAINKLGFIPIAIL